jgi:sarcosine oxidase subunit alpha
MAVGAALSDKGRDVEVVDDGIHAGGSLRALCPADRARWTEVEGPFQAAVARGTLRLRSSTVAGGFYGADLLVVGPEGAEIATAEHVVLAPGAHDGVGLFEGNDVPGVMSARAAGLLLAEGVVVGKRVVIALAPDDDTSSFGPAFVRALRDARLSEAVIVRDPVRVRGASRVRGVVIAEGGRIREIAADALLVDAPRAPAYELCAQVGARLEHEPRGFVVRTDAGRIGARVWATGEVVGTILEPSAMLEDASRVARAIAQA